MEMVRVVGVERVRKFGHLNDRGPSKPLKLLTPGLIVYVHRDMYIQAVSVHTHVRALTRKK